MQKIKIAFDVHGVITSDPDKFRQLMNELYCSDLFEVWIVSGPREDVVVKELEALGIYEDIHYHQIDTIVEYLLRNGDKPKRIEQIDSVEHYFFDKFEWDTAKADICVSNDINILIDDTKDYQQYFNDTGINFLLY